MKFLPLATAVIFSICILHSASAQYEKSIEKEADLTDVLADEVSEALSSKQVANDGDLQTDEVMVYLAEKSELSRLMAKRDFTCRFCCKRGHCGICCSW